VQPAFTRTEALALVKVAETGLTVTKALGLIKDTRTAEQAIERLQDTISGSRRNSLVESSARRNSTAGAPLTRRAGFSPRFARERPRFPIEGRAARRAPAMTTRRGPVLWS